MKILVGTCFRGNDFATIKNFQPNIFHGISLGGTSFRENEFATIKKFDQKIFQENFWLEPVFEEIILQP